MQVPEYQIQHEHYKDLMRQAENKRLVREARGSQSMLSNARHALGRSLVQAGESLLKER